MVHRARAVADTHHNVRVHPSSMGDHRDARHDAPYDVHDHGRDHASDPIDHDHAIVRLLENQEG